MVLTDKHVVPTRALTARVRECGMMMRARELRSLARSLARTFALSSLYVKALSIVVDVMRCARAQTAAVAAADDRRGRCCRWMLPRCRRQRCGSPPCLPPTRLASPPILPPSPVPLTTPGPSRLKGREGGGQARAEKRQQQQRRRHRQRHPMRGHRIIVVLHRAPRHRISGTHTHTHIHMRARARARNLRSRYAEPRSD